MAAKVYEVVIRTRLQVDSVKESASEMESALEKSARRAAEKMQRGFNSGIDNRLFDKEIQAIQRIHNQKISMRDAEIRHEQQVSAQEMREIQRIHAEKQRMVTRETQDAQRAAREVARINAETVRQAETQARLRERAAKTLADVQIRENKRAANDFLRSMQEQQRAMREQARIAEQSKGGSFLGLAGAVGVGGLLASTVGALTSRVTEGGRALLEYSGRLEQAKIGFTTLLGSADAARSHLAELQAFAARTPFEFEDVVRGARRLEAMGTAAKDVVPLLTSIGNAISAVGGSSAELDRAIYAFGQIQAKGKLTGEEIRQLANDSIPVVRALADELGVTTSQVFKLSEEGKISSETFIRAFRNFSDVHFGNAMDAQSKTFLGALSNIHDALFITAEKAFEPLFNKIAEIGVKFGNQLIGADGLPSIVENSSNALAAVGGSIASYIGQGIAGYFKDFDLTGHIKGSLTLNRERSLIQSFTGEGLGNRALGAVSFRKERDIGTGILGKLGFAFSEPNRTDVSAIKNTLIPQIPDEATFTNRQKQEAEIAQNQSQKQSNILKELQIRLQTVNDTSTVASTKQALLKAGVDDLNGSLAKQALALAAQVDEMQKVNREAKHSELSRLTEQSKKLREEINALLNPTSATGQKRFEIADLERQRKDIEQILELRHELGKPLTGNLPKTLESRQSEIRLLERERGVHESILRIQQEQADAEAALTVAQAASTLQIVNAETRARTTYFLNIRERREAEQQLTADLALEFRARSEQQRRIEQDFQNAQTQGVLDRLKEFDSLRADATRAYVSRALDAVANPLDISNPQIQEARNLAKQLTANRTPVTERLDNTNNLLAKIEANTRNISMPAKYADPPKGATGGQTDFIDNPRNYHLNEFTARTQRQFQAGNLPDLPGNFKDNSFAGSRLTVGGQTVGVDPLAHENNPFNLEANVYRELSAAINDVIDTQMKFQVASEIVDAQHKQSLSLDAEDVRLKANMTAANLRLAAAEAIRADKQAETNKLSNINVVELERAQRLLNDLQNPDSAAFGLVLSDAGLERFKQQIDLQRDLIDLRKQSKDGFAGSESRGFAEGERETLRAREDMATQAGRLQYEILHANEDAAGRSKVAWLSSIRDIQRADEDAIASQIKSQVELADATTIHGEQVRAAVLGHLSEQKTMTQALGETFNSLYDGFVAPIDRGIDRLTGKMHALGGVLKSIIHQIASKVFQRLLDVLVPSGSGGSTGGARLGTAQASGGGLFGGIGSLFGGLFGNKSPGMATTGGFAGGNPAAAILGSFGGSGGGGLLSMLTGGGAGRFSAPSLQGLLGGGGGGITAPASLSGQGALSSSISSLAKTGISGLFKQGGLLSGIGFGSKAGSGGALASILPLLGVGAGAKVGGGGFGSIIGGVGGGLLGIGLTAAPALFGAGGALASPLIAGLFSNPITAIAGGALLIGALIIGKNKARRKDEETRTKILADSKSQITEIIRQVTANKLDGSAALTQAGVIRSNYLSQVSQIKDKKTRGIAETTVREIDAMIKYDLQPAVDRQLKRQDKTRQLVPEFARGGTVWNQSMLQLIKVKPGERFLPPREHERLFAQGGIIPGMDRGVDDTYMMAPQGARIQNKQQQFAQGGTVDGSSNGSGQSLSATESRALVIEEINLYEDSEGRIRALVKSKDFGNAVVKTVRAAKKNWDL